MSNDRRHSSTPNTRTTFRCDTGSRLGAAFVVLVVGAIYLTSTLLADIAYSFLNPRIRLGGVE